MFLSNPSVHEAELDDLLWEITRSLTLLFVIGGLVVNWFILMEGEFNTSTFFATLVLVFVDLIIYQRGAANRRVAPYAFIWSITLWMIALLLLNEDAWLIFLGLPTIMASIVLVSFHSGVNTALVFLVVFVLSLSGERDYPLLSFVAFSLFTAVLSWVTVETIYVALHWTKLSEQRANALLEESRQSREETLRTLKSLERSNAALRRTQIELRAAHREAEKARHLKEQFAANISHELRTPLNLVLGFTEVMSRTPEIYQGASWPPTLKEDIDQIFRSSRHLLEMIDDILELSRFQMSAFRLNREPTPIKQILEEGIDIARDLFRDREVELQVDLPQDLPIVEIDQTRIRQVILNLINNAYRFTESGFVRITARADEHKVFITVSDSGLGIPAENLPFIFGEFYQGDRSLSRRHGGTGLGLAISKEFVESHGGEIWVESTVGVGSSFTFAIPIVKDETESALTLPDEAAAAPTPEEKQVMLLIDPDRLVAAMVQEHLAGFDVVRIGSLAELEAAINEYYPDIIVHNVAPNSDNNSDSASLTFAPWIECSLPSRSWILKQFHVAAHFVKPVIASELIQAVRDVGAVRAVSVIASDPGSARLVERILQTSGDNYDILCMQAGDEAISQIQLEPPDLLVLDLTMPDLQGMRLLELMQSQSDLVNVPVILVSATDFAEDLLTKQGSRIVVKHPNRIPTTKLLEYIQVISRIASPH